MIEFQFGDNLQVMRELLQESRRFELVYLDPPFMTQRDFYTKGGVLAFSDKWRDLEVYVNYVAERVWVAWHLLSPTGSLILHVDWRTSHYFRVALDQRLDGELQSEIIWSYRRWPAKSRNLQHMHDTLLHYARPVFTFNQLYEPLAPSTTKQWRGKKQIACHDESGKRTVSSIGSDESLGAPMRDVWDIGIIAPRANERTGYPTQKPRALLERLVGIYTNEGDSVLDPFTGSGAMLRVAESMGRKGLGIDSSPEAAHALADIG